MRTVHVSLLALVVLATAHGSADAQTVPSDLHAGVAVKLSTLGVGLDVAVPVHSRVNVRAGFSTFGLTKDFDNDGMDLTAQLTLRSLTTGIDWFPFGGGFHVSPGLMIYNGTQLTARATVPAGKKFSLGDEDLFSSAANPIDGTATIAFRRVSPMLTLGWGNLLPRSQRRWSIPFELGVVYSRSPRASLSLAGSACNARGRNCRNIASDAALQRDLADQEAQLNGDLAPLKIIPVLSLGFSYRF